MVKFSDIKEVYNQQQEFFRHDESLSRELLATLPVDNANHALVISGIQCSLLGVAPSLSATLLF